MKSSFDLNHHPMVVIWEVTRVCDLACCYCRASAHGESNMPELTTLEGKRLLDDIAELNPPIFIFTGRDPLTRPDIYELVDYAAKKGLHPAIATGATPLLNSDSLLSLRHAGLRRLALDLNGPTPALHDSMDGVTGSFARTLNAITCANAIDLPVQINTTVSRRNISELEQILSVIRNFRIVMWSLFFTVPTRGAEDADLLSAEEFESAFARIYCMSKDVPFKIKTSESQHYRRYMLQQRRHKSPDKSPGEGIPGMLPLNESKGFMFISHTGEVQPNGFLPISAGNTRNSSVRDIYRNSELFQQLRNSANLSGKCGDCEFNEICGGSRARAFAFFGDPLAGDPSCAYVPRTLPSKERC
jgi:radical SAM protein